MRPYVKMFLKPVWVGKIHGVEADPLFPSVSVMLCSPFFSFFKTEGFNLYFFQFLKEIKAFSFETKTEGG